MKTKIKVSVAIATYNGEKYLAAQIKSILRQSRTPDEVIISDDNSSDRTVKIAKKAAQKSSAPIKINLNKTRLGVVANFSKAIRSCSGEIVFLADQDDYWLPSKIESYLRFFKKYPKINAVCSDAVITDENLKNKNYTLWGSLGYLQKKPAVMMKKTSQLKKQLTKNMVCGATLAFRKKFAAKLLPVPSGWMHDSWIGTAAISCGSLLCLSQATTLYRQHSGQKIGISKKNFLGGFIKTPETNAEKYKQEAEKLKQGLAALEQKLSCRSKVGKKIISEMILFNEYRSKLPPKISARTFYIAQNVLNGRYFSCANGFKSIVKDLFAKPK